MSLLKETLDHGFFARMAAREQENIEWAERKVIATVLEAARVRMHWIKTAEGRPELIASQAAVRQATHELLRARGEL